MLRLLLVTAAIIIVSLIVVRSCFFKKQPFNPDTVNISLHTGESGNDTFPAPAESDWIDNLIKKYIKDSENALIRATVKDTVRIEWLQDRVEDTDTAYYWVYQIGHDVTDEDGKRFVTDAWVYIDSLTRQLYEYDVPGERLVKWDHSRSQ